MARAYLDHAATSPMPGVVLRAYTDALSEVGNPASTHTHGQQASARLESSRERIARALGCDAAEVTLTGGGTEAVNLALKGMYWARRRAGAGPVLLIARGEHHATIEAAEWLRDYQGAQIVWLEIDHDGVLQPATLAAAVEHVGAEHVALASFLWVNNEVGSILPVAELCRIAEGSGIPTHVDAVAALGQIPINFADSGASALSVSAHKIGGPLGVGALILGRHAKADSLLHGGSQQRSRSGSQNVAGAVAFAAALDHTLAADSAPDPERTKRLADLRDRLIEGVREIDSTAVLRGSSVPGARVPGNAHFTFPGCQGDSLVFLLDAVGVSASVGSACQAGVAEISHVLLAMGLSEAEAAGALRFTLGPETLDNEVDILLAALPDVIARARSAGLN